MKLQRYGNCLLKHFFHAAKITFYFLSFSLEILVQPCRKILQTMSNYEKCPALWAFLGSSSPSPAKLRDGEELQSSKLRLLWHQHHCFSISPSFYRFPQHDGQLRDRRCCNDGNLKGLSKPRTALVFWSAPGSCLGRGHLSELSDRTPQILTNCIF